MARSRIDAGTDAGAGDFARAAGAKRRPVKRASKAAEIEAYLSRLDAEPGERSAPVRMLHHFACTGGTLISRAIQAQSSVSVLSEADPFSRLPQQTRKSLFAPSDMIFMARVGLYDLDPETIGRMFLASLEELNAKMARLGRSLVVRCHSHSQYCTSEESDRRPTVQSVIASRFETLSVVTVRHPLDSWAALKANNFAHFSPFTLDEYCARYLNFLEDHALLSRMKYESFVADPDRWIRWLCRTLELRHNADWKLAMAGIQMSGDSGRKGDRIEVRPRREIPSELAVEAAASGTYARLCRALEYDP